MLTKASIQTPERFLTLNDNHLFEWLPDDFKSVARGVSSDREQNDRYLVRNADIFTKDPYLTSYATETSEENKPLIVFSTR